MERHVFLSIRVETVIAEPDPIPGTFRVAGDGAFRRMFGLLACTLLTLLLLGTLASERVQAAPAAQASCTLTVTSAADSGDGSLRQAIAVAGAGSTICFDATLSGQTIIFGSEIAIGVDVTISGTIPITLSGNNGTRLFAINPATNVTLYGLTLRNGASGGLTGGAIRNRGVLTVSNSILRENSSLDSGGAIDNYNGALTVIAGQFISNSAGSGGGAIYNSGGSLAIGNSTFVSNTAGGSGGGVNIGVGTATVDRSTFRGNTAGNTGGAIRNNGVLVVSASSFGNNLAQQGGGGIINSSVMTLTAGTVSTNSVTGTSVGGGLYNAADAPMHISQVTVSDNSANGGGGIYNAGMVTIIGSVLSANAGNNCFDQGTAFTSSGYNVSSDASCSTPFVNTNDRNNAGAQTQPMQANGAAPLLPASVAINNVTDAGLCATSDQLGRSRLPAPCDTGALESGVYAVTPSAGPNGSISPNTLQTVKHGETTTFTVTASASYSIEAVTGCGGTLNGNIYTTAAITDDCTVNATFGLTTYPIVTATVPAAGGTVTCIPNPVPHGTSSNCSAAANSGYSFLSFSGACTGPTCTLANVTATQAVTATFCTNGSVVQNTADSGPGSLRQAVADTCAGNVIAFAPILARQTITFASQIVLDKKLTISGTVPITLSGNNATRIFAVTAGANVTLDGLTLRNGFVTGDAAEGGAIYNAGALTVLRSTLAGNAANGSANTESSGVGGVGTGGGIYNTGTLTFTQSTLNGNVANGGVSTQSSGVGGAGSGGGIYNLGTLALIRSTFSSNTAAGGGIAVYGSGGAGSGGGIYNLGTLALTQSTFISNTAIGATGDGEDSGNASGGGIYNTGALTLTQSTFSGNSTIGGFDNGGATGSASGGGIYNTGTLAVVLSTLSGNTATGGRGEIYAGGLGSGGGIYNTGSLALAQSIFRGNTATGGDHGGNGSGGGIHSAGTLTLTQSTFSSNTATGGNGQGTAGSASGGGIYSAGALTLTQSSFSGNTATAGNASNYNGTGGSASGGGIYSAGTLALTQSTLSSNTATGGNASDEYSTGGSASGGGIYSTGILALTQGTFSGNAAAGGIASNTGGTAGSASGGGIFGAGNAVMRATASVLNANKNITASVATDGNCAGALTSGGYNVSSDATCPFAGRNDITNVPVQTLPVQLNGTAPLLASSLAINNVTDPALCTGSDQLGNPRPTPCSAGALEFIIAATTRYVATTGSDAGNNSCLTSGTPCLTLARALEQAVDGNTIRIAAGAYLVANQPISKSVLILGFGSGQTILQANPTAAKHSNGRVLGVVPGRYVTLSGLTVRHGWGSGSTPNGGGIANAGVLTVRNSALLSNTVEKGGGGGVYNAGQLYMLNSTLAGNRAFTENATAGVTAATGVQLGVAGLMGLAGLLGLVRPVGGSRRRAWLRRTPPLLVVAMLLSSCFGSCSTLAAGQGGALFNDNGATAVLRFTTLAHNTAGVGGGAIFNAPTPVGLDFIQPGAVHLGASVLSQNTSSIGVDCSGQPVISLGRNVAAPASGCGLAGDGDVQAADQVMAVQANGSAPLQASSAAIDRVAAACPTADQVGGVRPATCDAGAAEFAGAPQARLQISLRGSPERPYVGQTVVYTATLLNNGAVDAATVNVTVAIPAGLTFQNMTHTGGSGCAINGASATCAALARGSQVTFVARATVATAAVGTPLTTTVTAQASNSAQATMTFLVVIRAVPPPSVGCGVDYTTIQAAVNAAPANSEIELCPGTYKENVTIDKNVTIRSRSGAATTIVDGNQVGRVFDIQSNTVVTLEGLTIQKGATSGNGGGIRNGGTLTVINSILRDNSAYQGGGIYNGAMLTVNNSTFRNNSASDGGGIDNPYNGTATVNNSIFSVNTAAGNDGGGIRNYNTLTVNNSIFSGNSADSNGGGIFNYGTLMVTSSTFYGNIGDMGGGGICNFETMTVKNSIISGNRTLVGAGAGIFGNSTASNSVLQDSLPIGNGNKVNVSDAGFVDSQQGNLHLVADSSARGIGVGCLATDLEGKTRAQPDGCSAGAYEFKVATAGGLAHTRLEPLAAATVHSFTSVDGDVTLDISAGAVTQTVELAFSLGRPTGGDPAALPQAGGRSQGVLFTPYDATGNPLGENFTFLQPLRLTLEYDPLLVTHGLEVDLFPMRFERAGGLWLPFTANVVVDKLARTVTFPILQAGEYGLFSTPPQAAVAIAAAGPAGVVNVDGGSTLLYTLAALNATSQPQANVTLRHVLPAGVTFVEWVDDGSAAGSGAVYAGGVITWALPGLAGGGLRYASFNAQVSADAAFQGRAITSTATLTDAAGLALSSQAVVSVNGPTTPVNDSATTRPGQTATLWPLMNDINPDGSPLALTALGAPAHGIATIVGDTVIYTPTAGFEGNDSFAYTVKDGQFSAQGQIQVRVARLAFLGVLKTVAYGGQKSSVLADVPRGSRVVYTLELFNGSGGEVAANAALTDVLPAGVTFSSWITQAGATLSGSTITWRAASVPTATVTAISFRAVITGTEGSTVENRVQATAANADPTQASARVQLAGIAPLQPLYLPIIQRAATASGAQASAADALSVPDATAAPLPTDAVPPETDAATTEMTEHSTYLPAVNR